MGLRDGMLIFSDNQSVLTTAFSAREINSGLVSRELGEGSPLNIRVIVMETYNNLVNVAIQLAAGPTTAPTTLVGASITAPLASLVRGAEFVLPFPFRTARFWRISYTVAAGASAATTGRMSAWIDPGSGGYHAR